MTGQNSSSSCALCPAGSYGADPGMAQASCSGLCAQGYWCAAGSTNGTAAPCPVGRYGSELGMSTPSCTTVCRMGAWCAAASKKETLCAAGRFGAAAGLSTEACSGACRSGSFCAVGSVSDADCAPGYYCATPASKQLICVPGSFCPARTLDGSTPCAPGFFCKSPAVNETCPKASYCPAGSMSPTRCPVGRFGDAAGLANEGCSGSCIEGSWSNTSGMTSANCIPCAEGFFCFTPVCNPSISDLPT